MNLTQSDITFRGLPSILLMGALAAGCGGQSNGGGGAPQTTTAAATAAVSSPRGPYERGEADPDYALDPATQGPKIVLRSPARGAQLTGNPNVTVEVGVSDPNGVDDVVIGGRPGTDQGNGNYAAQVPLELGVNIITVEARDGLGNSEQSVFSVVFGTFQSEAQLIDNALAINLSDAGAKKMIPTLEDLTKGIDLEPLVLARNPLVTGTGYSVQGEGLTHGPPRFRLEGVSGGLTIQVNLANLDLDLRARVIGIGVRAELLADDVEVIMNASIDPTQQQVPGQSSLGLVVRNTIVNFVNFRVRGKGAITNAALNLFRGAVQRLIKDKIRTIVGEKVVTLLGGTLAGIDKPVTIKLNIPGIGPTSLDLQGRLNQIDGDPLYGVSIAAGIKATATAPVDSNATDRFLALGTRVQAGVGGGNEDVSILLTADGVNAALHAFWRAGGMKYVIDGAAPPKPGEAPGLPLSARILYPFFPVVKQLAPDPNTPLRVEISAGAAPVVRFGHDNRLVQLDAGELELRVMLDYMDGKPPRELFTLRAPMRAAADIAVEGNAIKIQKLAVPHVAVDLIREPEVDFADGEIELFLNSVLPDLVERFTGNLPAIPIPALPAGFEITSARMEAIQEVLVIRGTLSVKPPASTTAPSTP